MLTSSGIELIKYVINNNHKPLSDVARHFNKTPTFIRNEVMNANLHLETKHQISIKNSVVFTAMEYNDYLKFMARLDARNYSPTVMERLEVILVLGYFQNYLNLRKLYEDWGISLTTKKSDIKHLEKYLEKHDLSIERKPGSGIRITGSILHYRVLLIQIISKCIDVNDFFVEYRGANTPYERLIYQHLISFGYEYLESSRLTVHSFLEEYGNHINYYSKKFFLLYVILASYPRENTDTHTEKLVLEPLNLYLFSNRNENIAFNQVASMIDFDPVMPFPYNNKLHELITEMFQFVQSKILTTIHTKDELIEELYTFVYRQYFVQHFNYVYEDKLVKGTSKHYPWLYAQVNMSVTSIESYLQVKFNEEQITSFTLIFSKWISKNRLHGRNRKRIVLVTNVGFERVAYFIEKLKEYIEFEHVGTIDVNELNALNTMSYDLILSFSKRTQSILKKLGYDALLLKFFLENQDILALYDAGCSSSKRRLLASDIVEVLSTKSKEDQIAYLTSKYDSFFL